MTTTHPDPHTCPARGFDLRTADEIESERQLYRMRCEQLWPGWVLAPVYRGYANLGIGEYLLNHSRAGEPAEFVISIATEEEKAGRVVGDQQGNAGGAQIEPQAMAVRLRFANVAGLDALEQQLRHLRNEHFAAAPASPA